MRACTHVCPGMWMCVYAWEGRITERVAEALTIAT